LAPSNINAADEAQDTSFLDAVRRHAHHPELAMSLRALHRAIEPEIPMSLATASRRMAKLVASGDVICGEGGYYTKSTAFAVDMD